MVLKERCAAINYEKSLEVRGGGGSLQSLRCGRFWLGKQIRKLHADALQNLVGPQ